MGLLIANTRQTLSGVVFDGSQKESIFTDEDNQKPVWINIYSKNQYLLMILWEAFLILSISFSERIFFYFFYFSYLKMVLWTETWLSFDF